MKWLIEPVILESAFAALIAEDLRALAAVDGEVHEREQSLIDAFTMSIPDGVVAADAVLDTPHLQKTYVRSMVMLALADGDLTEDEHGLIVILSERRGVPRAEVDRIIEHLGVQFYGSLEAARTFRSELRTAAREAGLTQENVEEMWN